MICRRVGCPVDPDCGAGQAGVGGEGEPGSVVLAGANGLAGDRVRDDGARRVAAGGGRRAGVAAGAGRQRAARHGRAARRQRRRRAGAAVRRGGRAAGARPAAAHEQLRQQTPLVSVYYLSRKLRHNMPYTDINVLTYVPE